MWDNALCAWKNDQMICLSRAAVVHWRLMYSGLVPLSQREQRRSRYFYFSPLPLHDLAAT